ncbi:DUF1559 family PulG-like putative transporter [Gimesia aquarii]|uniref:Uncharacterized protein n=1 Tax=Gimesia aquarii TaxID=2527964 RepID=A0A517VVM1_9PLAN|nr:DUF1559 domain-containing protein [Gimesia aquarii]QDT97053.1 hypothetical protein V144x_25240 [Gimesia aquarii]
MANWYVKRGSQIAGPLTLQRLNELAAQGKVQETDLVREGEENDFVPASQIPGLIPEFGSNFEEDDYQQGSQSQTTSPKKSNAVLWIVVAVAGGGFVLVILILMALLLPAVQQARDAARRSMSKNNMKQIGLALHNYHDVFSQFPPGGTATADGKPYHSWQTAILPFVDQAPLYNDIDFDVAWDDPSNQIIFEQEIPTYLNPSIEEKISPDGLGLSHYVGNELVMKKNGNIGIRDMTDGTSNTILAVETGQNFKPWGDPTSIAKPTEIMGQGKKSSFRGGNHVLMGDGSVRFVSENIDPETLKNLSIPNDGKAIGEF